MYGVRIHGRGGQGVVTTAELLSVAAFEEGRHAQAFPTFGSERMGAPVVAFCRISEAVIRAHEPLTEPDVVLVQDPTLLGHLDVLAGLRPGGLAVVNTAGDSPDGTVPVPASEIARRHLGRTLPGAAMLGALSALHAPVSLVAVQGAFRHRFPGELGEANARVARDAFELVLARHASAAHA